MGSGRVSSPYCQAVCGSCLPFPVIVRPLPATIRWLNRSRSSIWSTMVRRPSGISTSAQCSGTGRRIAKVSMCECLLRPTRGCAASGSWSPQSHRGMAVLARCVRALMRPCAPARGCLARVGVSRALAYMPFGTLCCVRELEKLPIEEGDGGGVMAC